MHDADTQLLDQLRFARITRPVERDEAARKALDPALLPALRGLTLHLREAIWDRGDLENVVTAEAEARGTTLGKLAGPLRAALAGRTTAPSVFDMMLVLGRDETLARLEDVIGA